MKTLLCLVFLGTFCISVSGQAFIGSTPGLASIGSNPSLISASRNDLEIQVFSVSASFAGNQPYFSIAHLNPRYFSNTIFQNTGLVSGYADISIMGPAVMKRAGRNTFAFFTRARVNGTVRDFDGQLAHSLNEQYFSTQSLPFKLSSSANMRANLNAWSEFGFTYSRTLLNTGNHRLSAGSSVRFLAGIASANFDFGAFEGIGGYNKKIKDYAINEASGTISADISGIKISGLNLNRVVIQGTPALASVKIKGDSRNLSTFNNRGLGVDVGVTYEFRRDGEEDNHNFRMAVALVDVGAIRYRKDMQQSGRYKIKINESTALRLKEVFNLDLVKARQLFNNHPENFEALPESNTPQFNTSLPTALNFDLDQRITERIFIASSSHIAVTETGWSYTSLIPRFETNSFTLAVPVTYDWLSNTRAGLYMRYKFVTIGSAGLFTSIAQPTKQMDATVGVSFGVK